MAELADATALGAVGRKVVQVQVLFPAPTTNPSLDFNAQHFVSGLARRSHSVFSLRGLSLQPLRNTQVVKQLLVATALKSSQPGKRQSFCEHLRVPVLWRGTTCVRVYSIYPLRN